MNKDILISVILPVYNTSDHLEKCLDSILNQSLKNIEIIAVNDGSTDASIDILNGYAKQDSRLQVYSQENQGVSVARNFGILKSKGTYITFVDSDDWIHKDMLKEMIETAEKNNSIIVKCDVFYVRSPIIKNKIYNNKVGNETMTSKEVIKHLFTIHDETHFGYTHSKIYRRDFINKNALCFKKGMSFAEDTLFFVEACMLAGKVTYLQKQLYYYNLTNESLTRTYIKNLSEKYILLHSEIDEILKQFEVESNIYILFEQYKIIGLLSIIGNETKIINGRMKKLRTVLKVASKIKKENQNLFQIKNISKYKDLTFKKKAVTFIIGCLC